MKEEKGGVIHIFFIFIGICLLCLGTFYYFTDDKVELNKDDNKEEVTEDKDIINQINLMNNVETKVTLKNKKEVNIKYSVSDDTNIGSFYLDNRRVFEASSELEQCSQFYLYNNSIISYCIYGSATSGHLYIIDSNGEYTKVDSFNDKEYSLIPESIQIKNEKLIVNGIRVSEGSILKENDIEIDLCNEDAISNNNIDLKTPAFANYELVVKSNKPEFIFMNTTKTLEEFIGESCKIVE